MARKTKGAKPAPIDHARMLECIRGIKEREQAVKNLNKEIEAYKQEVKDVMRAHKLEEMECDVFTVRFIDIVSQKLDTKAFKEQCRSIYDKFLKTTTSKQFTIK